jgi:hypothetical protein
LLLGREPLLAIMTRREQTKNGADGSTGGLNWGLGNAVKGALGARGAPALQTWTAKKHL